MQNDGIQIKVDDLTGLEIAAFLSEHLNALAEITPAESRHALNLDELRRPDVTFWSAWSDGELVGCGALKEIDPQRGEVKSMRTAKTSLRKGIASKVLQQIISEAKRRGYRRLSLETGSQRPFEPARQLYSKFGFRPCPPFNGYIEDPNSAFMTLELS